MLNFSWSIVWILFYILGHVFGIDRTLNCPLVWVDGAFGEATPPYAVPAALEGSIHFIARFLLTDGKYYAGRIAGGKGYVAQNDDPILLDYYQVLTNPHSCILKWEPEGTSKYLVRTDKELNTYIGRAFDDTVFLSGQVEGGSITFVTELVQSQRGTKFDLLTSYSKGLVLEMTKFDFGDHTIFSTKDMLGIDEIHNMADTTVTQSFTHKKSIMQSTTISNSKSWGHTFKVGFKIDLALSIDNVGKLSGLGIEFDYEYNKEESEFSSRTRTVKDEYSITRQVTVEPYSSLQVCSTVTMAEAVSLDYTAEGRYSAPGLTASQVAEILKEDGKQGYADGDTIVVEESGKFDANMGLMALFITTPMDDLAGCSQLSTKIQKLKMARRKGEKNAADLKKMAADIDNFISELARKPTLISVPQYNSSQYTE